MNRRIASTATVALLLCVGLVGCGIPAETEVRVDGKGPQSGQVAGNGFTTTSPARLDSDVPEVFAANYLAAAAGEVSGTYDRVNSYIPDGRGKLKQKAGSEPTINIVRVIGQPQASNTDREGHWLVTINVQQVGVLHADGSVGEPEATETRYQFEVGTAVTTLGDKVQPLDGLWVVDPPPVLLLSTNALDIYYAERTIYFWNADRTALVPDPRYLALSVPKEQQATEVLGWLIAGPAPWLAPAALPLPDGTTRIGNVPKPSGRLEVNLNVPASEVDQPAELDRLFTQLVWSLLSPSPDGTGGDDGELELKIQSQSRKVANVDDYRRANPPYRLAADPKRFCVYEGSVHPLRIGDEATEAVPIKPEENQNVHSAALTRDGNKVAAALVTAVGGRFRLRTAAGADTLQTFAQSGSYGAMDRPLWLKGVDPRTPMGLVVADGRLYQFGAAADLKPVALPGVSGTVTGVGAAPDGHRLAVIAGGALYVAALSTDGGTVTVGRTRRLVTSLRDLTALDWSGENLLAVAGVAANNRPVIESISVDGAIETVLLDDTRGRVTHLTAYPTTPLTGASLGFMYEANGLASAMNRTISREQVEPNAGQPTPSSPASDVGKLSAPFFRY